MSVKIYKEYNKTFSGKKLYLKTIENYTNCLQDRYKFQNALSPLTVVNLKIFF